MARFDGMMRAGLLAILLCLGAAAARAQGGAPAIYLDKGADRQARLVAKAREEGMLLLYTSMSTSESGRLGQAFEKKFGVKVQIWRNLSEAVIQRTVAEARAKRHSVDAIETNAPEVEALAQEGLVAAYHSPQFSNVRDYALPAHRKWVSDRVNLFVVGYNTAKVKRDELPGTYEGFADPKWNGRLGIEATDQEWLGALMKYWGQEQIGRAHV